MHLLSSKSLLQSYLVDELDSLVKFNRVGKRSEIIDARIENLQECLAILRNEPYSIDTLEKIENKFASVNSGKRFGAYRYGCFNCGRDVVTAVFVGQCICRDCAQQIVQTFDNGDQNGHGQSNL